MMSLRLKPLYCGLATALCLTLLPAAAPAEEESNDILRDFRASIQQAGEQISTAADDLRARIESKEEARPTRGDAEADPPGTGLLRMTILQVTLDEEHRFGTGLSVRQLQDTVLESGIHGLASKLEEYGTAAIDNQSETEAIAGRELSIFAGREHPYIHTMLEEDGQRRTTTQSSVRSSTTMSLAPLAGAPGLMALRLEHDGARPFRQEGRMLFGRDRFNAEMTVNMSKDQEVKITRQLTEMLDGHAAETYFILEFEKLEP